MICLGHSVDWLVPPVNSAVEGEEASKGPSKSELKKRAKEAEKAKKAAEKAAKQAELEAQKAAAEVVCKSLCSTRRSYSHVAHLGFCDRVLWQAPAEPVPEPSAPLPHPDRVPHA